MESLVFPEQAQLGSGLCGTSSCPGSTVAMSVDSAGIPFNDASEDYALSKRNVVIRLQDAASSSARTWYVGVTPRAVFSTAAMRWMGEAEHEAMLTSGIVQESTLGGVTSVTRDPMQWIRQTEGGRFVEFDVPTSALRASGTKIYGPNSIFGKPLGITEMPPATNIEHVMSKWPRVPSVARPLRRTRRPLAPSSTTTSTARSRSTTPPSAPRAASTTPTAA
jgi:hypothetical protein